MGKPTFGGTRGNAQGGPIAAVCSDRERQSTARPQLLREQAIINGLVRRDRHTRFSRKTHYGAIPGFKLGRLAVDNVSLQRRRRVFGEAIEKRHRVGNDTCRQSHSPRFGDCVHLLHATLEQPPRLRYRADDTNWGARQRTHPAERHDEQKLIPQRLVDIGGDFDLHGCAFEDSP